jgi:ribose transport system permease protein
MNNESLKRLLKNGAIWGFILFELVFFSRSPGVIWSLSDSAFMDLDNMLLLLKQSAPIGIIALGMTIIMINGNIDLSRRRDLRAGGNRDARQHDLAGLHAGFGRLGDPVAWILALLTGVSCLALINGLIVWKTGVDAFIVTLGAMLGYRGLVFMYNGEQPTSHLNWTLVDFAEAQFLGLHTATWFLLAVVLAASGF